MKKDTQICIKVSSQQKENLRDLGVGFTECFERGYEFFMENYKEKLGEIVEKRKKEYIRVYTKLENFDENKIKELTKLDTHCNDFVKNRNVENPTNWDINWIKSRIKKHNLRISVDGFLNRCKEIKED